MNQAAHQGWGIGVKTCGLLLAAAVLVLLAQIGSAPWLQDIDRDHALTTHPLHVETRHLLQLARALHAGAPVEQDFQIARTRLAQHVQQQVNHMASALPPQAQAQTLMHTWAEMDTAAGQLLTHQRELHTLSAQLAAGAQHARMLKEELDTLAREMIASGSPASQVYLVLHQVILAGEMARRVEVMTTGDDAVTAEMAELAQEIATFNRVLTGLQRGDAQMALQPLRSRKTRARLDTIQTAWAHWQPMLETIIEQAPLRLRAQSALLALEHGADPLLVPLQMQRTTGPAWPSWVSISAGGLALMSGLGLWQGMRRQRHYWEHQAAHLRHREHTAFAQLLDEMGALAEGDLTIKTTVSGEITGALAEAINFAAQQLGARLQTMHTAITQMQPQAEQSRALAIQLSQVSQYQMQELNAALDQVQRMTTALEALLGQLAASPEPTRHAARACIQAAQDVTVMIDTAHSVTARLNDQARQALDALDRLAQAVNALHHSAAGFTLPN